MMVAAIAFACIHCNGLSVRRVEFTAEFKACLPFLRYSGLDNEPLDMAPVEVDGAVRAGVEQHLHVAHAATAAIVLPPLAFLRYASLGEGADPTVYLRAFGICLQDRGSRRDSALAAHGGKEPRRVIRPLDRLADVVDHMVRYGEYAPADRYSPFRFVASGDDPLGDRAVLEGVGDLKIIAVRKVRAVLLVEPPSYGSECRLRLYTDTDRPRPSAAVIEHEKARAYRTGALAPKPAPPHLLDNDREA